MAGLNAEGYRRRTFDEILEDKIQKAKELFGEDINTEENTPLGKFLRINAYDQSKVEEEAELIYYSIFPHTAFGTSLDRLCTFVGIQRHSAQPSEYEVKVSGIPGTAVPIGFKVSTDDGYEFYNTVDTIIESEGTCIIDVVCDSPGEMGNVYAEDIKNVVNPVVEITGVVGTALKSRGTNAESDNALRKRFDSAISGSGSCNEDAIKAALLRIDTITSAGIVTNNTNYPDSEGRPPHSFECFISGGENHHEDIAKAIYDKKPIGIPTYGKESYTITDKGGYPHEIKFSHTQYADIYVRVIVKTNTKYEGERSSEQIKANVMSYINGLGVGASVFASSLYGQVHSVQGVVEIENILLRKTSTPWQNSIICDPWQIPRSNYVEVEVD